MTRKICTILIAALTLACGGGGGSSAPIALSGPGFTATPVSGTAGGPTDGSTLGDGCIGMFPTSAQHVVNVGAAIPMLRVLVNAGPSNDTTLAVRRPDGTYVCNDDSGDPGNGLNPVAEVANAAPGEYQIFVGGYAAGDTWASYNLTFNETAGVFPSTAAPAP
jgi:hypothetical protein